MSASPWPHILRRAAREWGWPPREVWALSLREWRLLTAAPPAAAPLGRAELEALLQLHPDDPA